MSFCESIWILSLTSDYDRDLYMIKPTNSVDKCPNFRETLFKHAGPTYELIISSLHPVPSTSLGSKFPHFLKQAHKYLFG